MTRRPGGPSVLELVPGEAAGTIIPPEEGSEGAALERRHRPPEESQGMDAGQAVAGAFGCGFSVGFALGTTGALVGFLLLQAAL